MSPAASYVRKAGEYERPAGRHLLHATEYFETFPRGVLYHDALFKGLKRAQSVEVELVPEPGNPHDSHAVALDYRGRRFGYLSAGIADSWHDIVRAANVAGLSVWANGRLDAFEFDDGGRSVSPTLMLPRYDEQRLLADRFGLMARAEALLAEFDETSREELLEASREELPGPMERALRAHAARYPEFCWSPPTSRRGRVPGVLYLAFRGIARRERLDRAEARREAASRARAEKLAARLQARQEAAEARERTRRERFERAAAAVESGLSNEDLGAELGVSASTAAALKREVRGHAWNRNAEVRAERMQRCAQAVKLQDDGLTRAQIAIELACGTDTVGGLLRDGRFFADPSSDKARGMLAAEAAHASSSGMTRAQWRASRGLSAAKAAEAWKDADVLHLSGSR